MNTLFGYAILDPSRHTHTRIVTTAELDRRITRDHWWTGEVIEIPDPPPSGDDEADDMSDANTERYLEVTMRPKTVLHAQPVQLG